MKLIDQTETHEYYLDTFNGSEVRLVKDIETGTFSIFTEDLAKALGFESEEQMLSSDIMLDYMNVVGQETGKFPLSTG